jgi:hypothetical protein
MIEGKYISEEDFNNIEEIFLLLLFACTGLEIILFKGGTAIISNRVYDEFYTK